MMSHPFIGDLSDKSMDELLETINSLNNKLLYVGRSRNNPMFAQLQMVLHSYRSELAKRQEEMFKSDKSAGKISIT